MCMSSALNGRSVLQHFKHSNAVEVRNGIMFDFYPGLPHNCIETTNFFYGKFDKFLRSIKGDVLSMMGTL